MKKTIVLLSLFCFGCTADKWLDIPLNTQEKAFYESIMKNKEPLMDSIAERDIQYTFRGEDKGNSFYSILFSVDTDKYPRTGTIFQAKAEKITVFVFKKLKLHDLKFTDCMVQAGGEQYFYELTNDGRIMQTSPQVDGKDRQVHP